ncbi:MAG: Dabb family protein [Burkholderiaceae bacterium]|jgi:hypothetical protein|nr:MAG: Dabb family protein [Burkholderiaceae bacterium]
MIKHIVLWNFKDHAAGADKATNMARAKERIQALAQLVPGMVRLEVAAAEPGFACTCDFISLTEFADRAALDAYQSHPKHQPVKAFMRSVTAERHAMDYQT